MLRELLKRGAAAAFYILKYSMDGFQFAAHTRKCFYQNNIGNMLR